MLFQVTQKSSALQGHDNADSFECHMHVDRAFLLDIQTTRFSDTLFPASVAGYPLAGFNVFEGHCAYN